MLAIVRNGADARAAASAGADALALVIGTDALREAALPDADLAVPLGLIMQTGWAPTIDDLLRLRDAAGAADIRLALDRHETMAALAQGGVRIYALVPATAVLDDETVHRAVAAGAHGIMVGGSDEAVRLVDAVPPDRLATFAAACRAARLALCLTGRLEGPDIPRLMALDPDELGFDAAIHVANDPAGPIDPAAIAVLRALVAGDDGPRERPARVPDRIFVRDLTLSMSIGAYARERNVLQRIRLSVEADVGRRSRPVTELRDVVSYDLITDAVRRLAAAHVDLVETFAESIAEAVLRHPRIDQVTVTVEKLDVIAGSVGCRIVREREHDLRAGVAPPPRV